MDVEQLQTTILKYPLVEEIDPDLILLAITDPETKLDETTSQKLMDKYNDTNNDALELIGDRAMDLAIVELIFAKGLSVGKMSFLKSVIVRNVSLICLMNDRGLCNLNTAVKKSCADLFEALVGAVYLHLKKYNVDTINVLKQWLIEVWNIEFMIDYAIAHPNETNICNAIERQYDEFLNLNRPNLDYLKNHYDKLVKYYEYFRLGKIETVEFYDNKKRSWVVKIICPLTLGCQFYVDKSANNVFIGVGYNKNKQMAYEYAAKQAIYVILNDYQLQ